ncbi:hypothetical protein L1887_04015 [Cichorium endivia]|nr:hypothetical protein L1887_04015 [Cichorium endivia]
MGNIGGKKPNIQEFDQDERGHVHSNVQAQVSSIHHAHFSPTSYKLPLMFTPQVPVAYRQNPNHIMLTAKAESECPSSPISSYNNPPFTIEDLNEKLPELPPLLQQTPVNQPAAAWNRLEALQEPLSVNLNHLYTQRGNTGQPTLVLGSSLRFRSKFVTTVLYKPLKKVRN